MEVVEELKKQIQDRERLHISYGISSPAVGNEITRRYKQLEELQQLITECDEKENIIRRAESEEDTTAALQPLFEKYNIVQKEPSVSFAPEVMAKKETAAPTVQPKEEENEGSYFVAVSPAEYAAVPTYLKGRMTLNDLNATLTTMDTHMTEKATLLKKPMKQLKMADKNRVLDWKQRETVKCCGQIWLTDVELKAALTDKLKTQLKHSLPVLRHLKIIREIREKNILFVCPHF